MDQFYGESSTRSPFCMADWNEKENANISLDRDAIPDRNGTDLWYSLGFGMSEMFFVHALSEITATDMRGYIPQE